MIGKTIAHYKITAKLGEGGMGEAYRATDDRLNRDVAIKLLPDTVQGDPTRLARFRREAQVLTSLTHGNLAQVYGLEEQEGRHAIVLELVEGEDLSERIKRGALPLEDAKAIALQIADDDRGGDAGRHHPRHRRVHGAGAGQGQTGRLIEE